MPTSDIDTAALVGKYISRQTTSVRLNADSDTASENQAIVESIAIALMLNPQAVLSVFLRAKNSLQQLITSEIEVINYVMSAIVETQNPDAKPSSTADLVGAQTALIELDRIGRVDTTLQAFVRYKNAVNSFLNNQLAPLVKRSPTGDFNRSGLEAKQDLFNAVGLFTQLHLVFTERLSRLTDAISNFNSVDLSRVVHTQTIARVRTSLTQIKSGMDDGGMSNTVAALELLAGTSALESIADTAGVYDDTIPLEQGVFVGPIPTAAFIESSVGPVLTSAALAQEASIAIDDLGAPFVFDIPASGKTGRPFVASAASQPLYAIPSGYSLFVDVTPGDSPGSDGVTHYEIPLTPGARTWASLAAEMNSVFGASGVEAVDFDTPQLSFIIVGASTDTTVQVLGSGPGSFDDGTGIFTPSNASAHAILGFEPYQTSQPVNSFDTAFLVRFFDANFPVSASLTADGRIRLTSTSTVPSVSQLTVAGQLMADFGFTSAISVPASLQLFASQSSDTALDPTALGVLPGSEVRSSAFVQVVQSIEDASLFFDPSTVLPLSKSAVRVVAPTVVAVQKSLSVLRQFVGTFDNVLLPLQGLLAPLLTTPSLAQVNDALRAFSNEQAGTGVKDRLQSLFDLLSAIVVPEAQQPANVTSLSVIQTLDERGMDRASDLFTQCRFTEFFGLTSETTSKSTRFMKAMESAMTKDFSTTTVEEDMPDGNLLAGENPTSILTTREVP